MPKYKVDFESLPWEEPAAGVRFKAVVQAGRKLRLVEFTDAFIEPDWCLKSHIGYVLEGELEIDFDGKLAVFRAGDGVFIPGGKESKHKAKVVGKIAKLIFVEDA